jgi:hypothetical protein
MTGASGDLIYCAAKRLILRCDIPNTPNDVFVCRTERARLAARHVFRPSPSAVALMSA